MTVEVKIFVVVFCFFCLMYASRSDIKSRSVANSLWLLMIAVGVPCALYNLFSYRIPFLIPFAFALLFTVVLAYLSFQLYLFGGADAKSLICISLLIPIHPDFHVFSQHFPIALGPNSGLIAFPFAISTLLNASILSLMAPGALFCHNLLNVRVRHQWLRTPLRYLFIGYLVPVNALPKVKHTRLVHWYEDREGDVEKKVRFGGVAIDSTVIEQLQGYAAEGKIGEEVWVTPDLPFMLFITAGFVMALLYGNFLFVFI